MSLFSIIIMNSPYRNSPAEHYGREIIWPGNTASLKTLCMEHYERLSAPSALFARKFDEAVVDKSSFGSLGTTDTRSRHLGRRPNRPRRSPRAAASHLLAGEGRVKIRPLSILRKGPQDWL